ncbi:MAG: M16 family metallopeptidase [Gemmatimonadaceae bacterium]
MISKRFTLRTTLLAAAAVGVAGSPLAAQRSIPPITFSTFTLGNGLEFIVHEDHSTPVVAVVVSYDAGGVYDPPGRSGFAHLFEHLMFQETEHLERGELARLVSDAGGFTNGATAAEWTIYVDVLPSHRLDLAFWLEAERMTRLTVTEENFRREREVVREEGRQRSGGQPDARASARTLFDTLATDYAPYDRARSATDLDMATVADVREFYEQYYSPNNATISVVGDITVAEVRTLAERYFGRVPRGQPTPPLPSPTPTPRTTGEPARPRSRRGSRASPRSRPPS